MWVSNQGEAQVGRYNPESFTEGPIGEFTVGTQPKGIAAGAQAIWVANSGGNTVNRIDPASRAGEQVTVEEGPTGVAFGDDAVWVTNNSAGTISRIDPQTNDVEHTIPVGNAPSGIVYANGFLWVTVQAP